jgi:hypothetical protein
LLRYRGLRFLCRAPIVEFDQSLADLDVISLAYEQSDDCPGHRRRNGNRRLVGLQLDQRLTFADLIPFMDQDLDDVASFDSFGEKRQLDFHGSVSSWC